MTAEELLGLYKDRGSTIFSRSRFRRIREAMFNPRSIVQEKYDADALEAELDRHIGSATLAEALTHVMITAYDIDARRTVFLTNTRRPGGKEPDDYFFREAARATSAAPTYFEPAQVKNLTQKRTETLVDGGVFANDPATCAYVEALKMGCAPENVTVVSIGTGYQNRRFPFTEAKDWGPLQWINPGNGAPIISILMHGQADSSVYHLNVLLNLPDRPKRFFRFDAELAIGNDEMDDASATNILALEKLAGQIIESQSDDLDNLVERLREIGS